MTVISKFSLKIEKAEIFRFDVPVQGETVTFTRGIIIIVELLTTRYSLCLYFEVVPVRTVLIVVCIDPFGRLMYPDQKQTRLRYSQKKHLLYV